MTKRSLTRTWHPEAVPSQPVAQVQDPAVRALMLDRRRCAGRLLHPGLTPGTHAFRVLENHAG